MKLSPLAKELYDELVGMTVIDAHEHLPAEADYLQFSYSGLNMFAGGCICHDLESAGLSSEFKATMREGGHRPVETWWPVIALHWEQIKHGSYARALVLTARDLYGLPEISDQTIDEFAARVEADNTPGLYRRTLQDKCKIARSITCVDQAAFPYDPGLCGITSLMRFDGCSSVRSLEEAAATAQNLLRQDVAAGAVGFKMYVGDYGRPDPATAEEEFKTLTRTGDSIPRRALINYLFDKCLDVAAEADVPVAVHTGYWGDFRDLDPKLMFSFAPRRPDVRFDMFHLGMPMVRDAAMMGKTLPNVTLNLAWCSVISQQMTAHALNEMIDLVPLNKIIAFGGDYRVSVQKVYGHLVMAKEVVASVLANRIEAGDLRREEALQVARLWFHDNPARIYRLDERSA
jgi:predicted TIM-barrel fold metal-dependent hydrolase